LVRETEQRSVVGGSFRINLTHAGSDRLIDGLKPLCVHGCIEIPIVYGPTGLSKRVIRLNRVQSAERQQRVRRVVVGVVTSRLNSRKDGALLTSADLVRDQFDFNRSHRIGRPQQC
jgi:hypothetical protein